MINKDQAFINDVMPSDLLDTVVEWIKTNMTPGDVFEEDEIIDWCRANTAPDDVFSDRELSRWAENNGYGGL